MRGQKRTLRNAHAEYFTLMSTVIWIKFRSN